MAELKDLFEKRDEAFKAMSEGIMRSIPNVLDGAAQFIGSKESVAEITWEDITYFNDEEFIMLIGVIEYKPGDMVEMPNGESIEITEATASYFKRFLRLGIPYKLALQGSAQDVFEFLTKTVEAEEQLDDELEQSAQQSDPSMSASVDNPDFNMDDLTEEQRKQFELFSKTHGGSN